MNVTGRASIVFVPRSVRTLVDADMEYVINSPAGLLTWVRTTQDVPPGARVISTFDVEDTIQDYDLTVIEQVVSATNSQLSRSHAQHAVTKFFKSIRQSVNDRGQGWKFEHGTAYVNSKKIVDKANSFDLTSQPTR